MLQTVDIGIRSLDAYRDVAPDTVLNDLLDPAQALRGALLRSAGSRSGGDGSLSPSRAGIRAPPGPTKTRSDSRLSREHVTWVVSGPRQEGGRIMKGIKRAAVAIIVAAMVSSFGVGHAQEGHSAERGQPPGGDTLEMTKFYTGLTPGQVGTFPGKLVCLRCNMAHAPGSASECTKEGHRHALSMDGGSMIHPLLAGTDEVLVKINSAELHGKNVKVTGMYYPSTGMIFANQVVLAE